MWWDGQPLRPTTNVALSSSAEIRGARVVLMWGTGSFAGGTIGGRVLRGPARIGNHCPTESAMGCTPARTTNVALSSNAEIRGVFGALARVVLLWGTGSFAGGSIGGRALRGPARKGTTVLPELPHLVANYSVLLTLDVTLETAFSPPLHPPALPPPTRQDFETGGLSNTSHQDLQLCRCAGCPAW